MRRILGGQVYLAWLAISSLRSNSMRVWRMISWSNTVMDRLSFTGPSSTGFTLPLSVTVMHNLCQKPQVPYSNVPTIWRTSPWTQWSSTCVNSGTPSVNMSGLQFHSTHVVTWVSHRIRALPALSLYHACIKWSCSVCLTALTTKPPSYRPTLIWQKGPCLLRTSSYCNFHSWDTVRVRCNFCKSSSFTQSPLCSTIIWNRM